MFDWIADIVAAMLPFRVQIGCLAIFALVIVTVVVMIYFGWL